MEEVSPWSRLGFGVTKKPQDSEEILLLRDQVIELSKQVASMALRLEKIESGSSRDDDRVIDNVFAVADYKDFFGEEVDEEKASDVEPEEDSEIIRVKSGFTAPPPKEVEKPEDGEIEPVGELDDVASEELPLQKEFDEKEEEEIVEGICDMVEQYIASNHAILNNQLKKKIYSDIPINDKIKKGIKEALANHPRIKAHKLDKFRTLYHMGEDADEEYAKAFS